MRKFRIIGTYHFNNRISNFLSKKEIMEFYKFKEKLKINPFLGKPLSYNFLKEKKLGGKRIYFLIYDELQIILFVDFSNKNNQQKTINEIKGLFPFYKKFVKEFYFN